MTPDTPSTEALTPEELAFIRADPMMVHTFDAYRIVASLVRQEAADTSGLDVDDQGRQICDLSYLCPHHTGRRA